MTRTDQTSGPLDTQEADQAVQIKHAPVVQHQQRGGLLRVEQDLLVIEQLQLYHDKKVNDEPLSLAFYRNATSETLVESILPRLVGQTEYVVVY